MWGKKMGFIARLNFPRRKPPVRAYLHTAGFDKVYRTIENALDYFVKVLDKNSKENDRYSLILAAIWGQAAEDKIRYIDFFGFSDINKEKWPGNPDISAWVMQEGVCVPKKEITCGDTLIVLGEEEKYRRKQKSLEKYISSWPNLGELEPKFNKNYPLI